MAPLVPTTLPENHRAFIDRTMKVFSEDLRVVGVAASGSYADDNMDQFSEVDLIIAVDPEHEAELSNERQQIASKRGRLLVAFTGEHVGEPRVLICLYGSPTPHVDLEFVAIYDVADRVDEPAIIWERTDQLTQALKQKEAKYPCPDMQWIEDRFGFGFIMFLPK